jgi:micrococcal nuclease
MLNDLLSKYQSFTTKQQVLTAIGVFILALVILPNVLVYGAAIFASHKLIQEVSFRRIFVGMFSVVAFFSFILLFADEPIAETVEEVPSEPSEVAVPEPSVEAVETTATSTSTTTPIVPEEEAVEVQTNELVEQEVQDEVVTPIAVSPTPAPSEPILEEPSVPTTSTYRVVSVVDGDTVKLDMNGTTESIRIIGLDTPETVHPSKPVECMGIEASNKAKQLLTGQSVRFESDDTQDTRDRFGRLLGYLFLPNGAYKYQSAFKAAEQSARANGVGLWADDVCVDEVEKEPEPEPQPVATPASDGSKWYVSSWHTSEFYYCEASDGWEKLSPNYLEVYESEAALKARYPGHTLHESCL